MAADAPRTMLRLQRPAVFGLVTAAAAISVIVSLAVVRARAEERAGELTDDAGAAAAASMTSLMSGLGGAGALVGADGSVGIEAFDAYAQDVVRQSPAQALGLVLNVPDGQQSAVEQAIGHTIVDKVGGGPAAHRPSYFVLRRVTPPAGVSAALTGVDLAMDPIRSAAIRRALATGSAVVSRPLASLPSGAPALFVAKPLFRPGENGLPRRDQPAALVTVGLQGSHLLQEIASALPAGARIEVRDGDALLAATDAPPEGGTTRSVRVLDREWSVRVDRSAAVPYGPVWLVAPAGAVVAGAVGIVLLRGARYERRLRKGTEAMRRLADLSRDLAVAVDAEDLARAVSTHVPAIVGAQLAGVAVVEVDQGRVRMVRRPDIPPGVTAAFSEISLMARSPIVAAVQTGEPVVLGIPR